MERVKDSALIPVNVERKVTLVGKHLNVFQVTTATRLCHPAGFTQSS